jgi:hypothetical protein
MPRAYSDKIMSSTPPRRHSRSGKIAGANVAFAISGYLELDPASVELFLQPFKTKIWKP